VLGVVFLTQNPCGSPDKVVSSSLFHPFLQTPLLAVQLYIVATTTQQQTTIRFSLPTTASFTF
jgi:hypothetical protein